jgi:hypothetical protein
MSIAKASTKPKLPKTEQETMTTGIHLPRSLYLLMNRVAFERAQKFGGRPSVSALIVGLIEKHRKELEKELAAASR